MNRKLALVLFFVLVIGGGLAVGSVTLPDGWYAALNKPAFNPPNWIFAPVWTALYVLIAIAGWRVWSAGLRLPTRLWWTQLLLNFLWSPTFFAAHQIGLALVVVLAMLAVIVGFIITSWRRERTAALLFVPYAVWVSFASLLNASILTLN